MMTDPHDINNPLHTMHASDPKHPTSHPHDNTLDRKATKRMVAEGNTATEKMSQFLNGGAFQHQHQHQSNKFSSLRVGGEVDKGLGLDSSDEDDGWVHVEGGTTYACGGMARAAHWLLEEVGPSLWMLVEQVRSTTMIMPVIMILFL